MDTQKPKKAFRHLFSRTEPDISETVALQPEPIKEQPTKAISKGARPLDTTPAAPRAQSTAPVEAIEVLSIATPATPQSSSASAAKVHHSAQESQSMQDQMQNEVKVQEAPQQLKREEAPFHMPAEPVAPPAAITSAAVEIPQQVQNTIASHDVLPLNERNVAQQVQDHPLSQEPAPYSFVRIQYNLDLFKAERGMWKENEYVSFINKIDQAQTDAFFLKGRLVSEIKERFYLDNKKGWSDFCEHTLNMNYTTANQYIRVAQEFDVTSHQRKDFGFEHFKALLPLNKTQRDEVLIDLPKSLSVKNLREIVAKKIQPAQLNAGDDKNSINARQIVDTLQKLKIQLAKLKPQLLSQEEKWQLYGAFQNLSEEMGSISHTFVNHSENKSESAMAN